MILIRKMNFKKLVVTHLNIHSIRNKFEALIQNVSGEIDHGHIIEKDWQLIQSFQKHPWFGNYAHSVGRNQKTT